MVKRRTITQQLTNIFNVRVLFNYSNNGINNSLLVLKPTLEGRKRGRERQREGGRREGGGY